MSCVVLNRKHMNLSIRQSRRKPNHSRLTRSARLSISAAVAGFLVCRKVPPLDCFQYGWILPSKFQRQVFLASSTVLITQSKVNLRQQKMRLRVGCVQSNGLVQLFDG